MIEFVTLQTAHHFEGNPIAAQHHLRYQCNIVRQDWEDVPIYDEMEYDQYDNPAAKYLVYRDEHLIVRGVARLYPTTLPYMLEQVFPHFVTKIKLPKSNRVWEGSRFCVNESLPLEHRRQIAKELAIGYLEVGLHHGIEGIIGIMSPVYLRSLFISNGWDVEFLGEIGTHNNDKFKLRAAFLPVSEAMLEKVRSTTGIYTKIVEFGEEDVKFAA